MPVLLLLLSFLAASPAALAQSEHPLTGRRIAGVMGVEGADWLERTERTREEAPERALDLMNIRTGMSVADVGTGTGFMALRMARRVGPSGRVYAEDVQPEMLDKMRERMDQAHLTNVEPVLGSEVNPNLPAGKLDLVLLVDVYHEFSRPQQMLQRIRESLKPDGRLVLLEYRKEDPTIPIRPEHKMSVYEARTEVEAEGFHLIKVLDSLPRQHLFIFGKEPKRSSSLH